MTLKEIKNHIIAAQKMKWENLITNIEDMTDELFKVYDEIPLDELDDLQDTLNIYEQEKFNRLKYLTLNL